MGVKKFLKRKDKGAKSIYTPSTLLRFPLRFASGMQALRLRPSCRGRYAYALNDPVKYNNPSGHWICEDLECSGGPSIRFRYGKGGPVSGGVRDEKPELPGNDNTTSDQPVSSQEEGASLEDFSKIFNWSLEDPNKYSFLRSPGYPFLGGWRGFISDIGVEYINSSEALTISNTGVGVGPWNIQIDELVFQYGESSFDIASSALNLHLEDKLFDPWGLKLSVKSSVKIGNVDTSYSIGFEYVARPDNWATVGGTALIIATGGAILRSVPTF